MPTVSINKELEFFYTDSGSPERSNYRTLVIIHGHTFHSGTFQRLRPIAASHSLRLLCINRREYPGTTPFSAEQLKVVSEGSETERAELLVQQGLDLGLLVNALIQECSLPEDGGITLVAWSLGNIFLLSLIASIDLFREEIKRNLQEYVKEVIMWEPPSEALGIQSPPGSYVPMWDEELAPEARAPAFGVWIASYFKHGDLSTRDFAQLENRVADASKKPSTGNMTMDELFSMADFAPADKCETILATSLYARITATQTENALFNPVVREAWKDAKFWHLYGDASTWNVHYAAWNLEKRVKVATATKPLINFKVISGANHFIMWDEPERALTALQDCIKLWKF